MSDDERSCNFATSRPCMHETSWWRKCMQSKKRWKQTNLGQCCWFRYSELSSRLFIAVDLDKQQNGKQNTAGSKLVLRNEEELIWKIKTIRSGPQMRHMIFISIFGYHVGCCWCLFLFSSSSCCCCCCCYFCCCCFGGADVVIWEWWICQNNSKNPSCATLHRWGDYIILISKSSGNQSRNLSIWQQERSK